MKFLLILLISLSSIQIFAKERVLLDNQSYSGFKVSYSKYIYGEVEKTESGEVAINIIVDSSLNPRDRIVYSKVVSKEEIDGNIEEITEAIASQNIVDTESDAYQNLIQKLRNSVNN